MRPARLRLGVRMQEKEPVAGGRRRAGRELAAPPPLALQEYGATAYGEKRGIVDRAGVGDDNLMWQLARSGEGLQRRPEHVCRIQRGDDDAQHRVYVPWSFMNLIWRARWSGNPSKYAWVMSCCAGVTGVLLISDGDKARGRPGSPHEPRKHRSAA